MSDMSILNEQIKNRKLLEKPVEKLSMMDLLWIENMEKIMGKESSLTNGVLGYIYEKATCKSLYEKVWGTELHSHSSENKIDNNVIDQTTKNIWFMGK